MLHSFIQRYVKYGVGIPTPQYSKILNSHKKISYIYQNKKEKWRVFHKTYKTADFVIAFENGNISLRKNRIEITRTKTNKT